MRSVLWQLNSSLLLLFVITVIVNLLLKKEYRASLYTPAYEMDLIQPSPLEDLQIETIYKNNLFGFIHPLPETEKARLIAPIPEPQIAQETPTPSIKKPSFIPPLNVTLKGVFYSPDDLSSAALIEDETGKERQYYLGESLKDAHIIRIAPERIILLRKNGQQETVNLRVEDEKIKKSTEITLADCIKKESSALFIVDPHKLAGRVPSLGTILDQLSLMTRYKHSKAVGLRVGPVPKDSFGDHVGLREGDVLLTINGHSLAMPRSRYEAFLVLEEIGVPSSIRVTLNRNGKQQAITYKVQTLPHTATSPFSHNIALQKREEAFPLDFDQKRQHIQRTFRQEHEHDRAQVLESIRKRLLSNIKSRQKYQRVKTP